MSKLTLNWLDEAHVAHDVCYWIVQQGGCPDYVRAGVRAEVMFRAAMEFAFVIQGRSRGKSAMAKALASMLAGSVANALDDVRRHGGVAPTAEAIAEYTRDAREKAAAARKESDKREAAAVEAARLAQGVAA